MMEKAIKQRLLGGLVLVAGAALFLPVLLDGSGAALTIPPLPAAPEVGGVEAMAPRLDHKVAETEQAVDAAHAGRDAAGPAPAEAAGPAGEAADVAPDAAAAAAEEGAPAAVAAKPVPATAAKPATTAPVAAAPAAKPQPAPTPAAPVAAKPATPVPAPVAKPVVPAKPTPAVATDKPASALPGAWVVQVASLSSRDKAQALVQQLRRKGYPAVLNPQGGMFKVVVGPELNRAVADSIKSRLAADPELKLSGWVQAYKP